MRAGSEPKIPRRRKRQTRSDGERTRAVILKRATALATLYGLEGLTIGRLADLTGLSKSGLFAHFGSKENLQLAIVAEAASCAHQEYTGPASKESTPKEQLWKMCEYFLSFVERKVYPGGCFFTAVAREVHALPDSVRRRVTRYGRGYMRRLAQNAKEAILAGELETALAPEQIAFELHALMIDANTLFIFQEDSAVIDRAWDGIRRLLGDPGRPRGKEKH